MLLDLFSYKIFEKLVLKLLIQLDPLTLAYQHDQIKYHNEVQ